MKLILENWKKFLKEGSTDSPDINDVVDYIINKLIPSAAKTGDDVSDHYIESITLDDIYGDGDQRRVGDLFDSTNLMDLVNDKSGFYDR